MRLKTCILVALTGSVLTAVPAAAQQAGEQDGSLRWTTTATNRQPATFNDVATGAGGTWAVGGDQKQDFRAQRPLAMRWDGKAWKVTAQPVQTNATLESVAVGTAKNVWAVGEDRTDPDQPKPLALHWNGTKWQVVEPPAVPTGSFDDVVIAPDASVWVTGWANVGGKERAVVYRYADGKWQALNAGLEGPAALHYNGTKWTKVAVPAGMAQLYDVALRDNRPVVVGEQFKDNQTATPYVLQLSGSKLVAAPAPKAATGTLTGIETAKDRVWTVGMSAASTQSPFTALAAFTR